MYYIFMSNGAKLAGAGAPASFLVSRSQKDYIMSKYRDIFFIIIPALIFFYFTKYILLNKSWSLAPQLKARLAPMFMSSGGIRVLQLVWSYTCHICIYKTPVAYKKIKGLGWWLIEIWMKFFQFLLKKAPKIGLLDKKVAVYLNFNWIF